MKKANHTRTNTIWLHLYEVQQSNSETESRIYQGLEEGNGESVFDGDSISIWDDEKLLGMVSGDGWTILWMYLVTLNYTLKMIKMINLLYILYCNLSIYVYIYVYI
jgi:hypothetical protein